MKNAAAATLCSLFVPVISSSSDESVDLEKLRSQERQGQAFVDRWVRRLCTCASEITATQLKSKIEKCYGDYKKLLKKRNKSPECQNDMGVFLKMPLFNTNTSSYSLSVSKALSTPQNCSFCTVIGLTKASRVNCTQTDSRQRETTVVPSQENHDKTKHFEFR